jgi:hypothetical protein
MTQYAQYNPSVAAPSPVIGWYDTEFVTYPNVPASSDLLELTAAQWTAHVANPSGWAVSGGALVAYTPPAPVLTLAQQAAAASVSGLTIALTGSITLAATLFPTTASTQTRITAVMTAVNATGDFPGGATTFPMPDASGNWHTFTVAQYKSVAGAIASYIAALDLIANGNPLSATALPASSVTLTV